MQSSKITQILLKWVPSGAGFFITLTFLWNQAWKQAVISFIASTIWLMIASFWEGFEEGLKEGAKERGQKTAEFALK